MLYTPPKDSVKGMNGKLLFIGGSKSYSGAALLVLKVAVKFSDIVLFYPAEYDEYLISSIKSYVPEVIVTYDLKRALKSSDSILFGSGAGNALFNFEILRDSSKKVVVDGDGLKHIKAPLSKNFLLTPNSKEFQNLALQYNVSTTSNLASSLNCIVLKKGYVNEISDGIRNKAITGGNSGLTKAGTGDILSGIIASLSTKNSLWDAAIYGLKAVLDASNVLFKQRSYYYSASEIVDFIGFSLSKIKRV